MHEGVDEKCQREGVPGRGRQGKKNLEERKWKREWMKSAKERE